LSFDIPVIVFVVTIGALAILAVNGALRNAIEKTCVYLFIIAHTFYSGIGIARPKTDDIYLIHYTVFMICLVAGLRFGLFLLRKKEESPVIQSLGTELTRIAKVGTILYFIVMLLPLVYPVNRLSDLVRVVINIRNIFERRTAYKADIITYALYTLKLILLPLVYVYISRIRSTVKIVIILAATLYLEVVQLGYIGRSGLLSQLFIIIGCVIIHRTGRSVGRVREKETIRTDTADRKMWKGIRRLILVTAVGLILGMPLLQDFAAYRSGGTSTMSDEESIQKLIHVETGFPLHYSYCEEYAVDAEQAENFSATRYLKWIATLPIPKFTSSSADAVNINYRFSELRTGNLYGTRYFYVLLPSLLGEGILLYGSWFYWIHGLFIGWMVALVIRFLSSVRSLRYWAVYIALSIVLMARGGSQGAISVIINYSLIVWVFLAVVLTRDCVKPVLSPALKRLLAIISERIKKTKEN